MTIIKLNLNEQDLLASLAQLATELDFTLTRSDSSDYLLMPPYSMCIHGIRVASCGELWCFTRDDDATSWEDFLLMHITHRIADTFGILLYYEFKQGGKYIEPTSDAFLTFDHYVEHVVRNDQGIMKNMKKNWLYTHKKRFVR